MSYQSRFSFVGFPVIPKQKADTKRPFCKEMSKKDEKTKKERKMLSMTFGVKENDANMAFVEAFGSVQDTILTFDTDNEKMEVDWDDRFDEDIVSKVANYRKYVVDLGEDHGGRQEFITTYDMIKHLEKVLPDYDGRVVVTGQFSRDWYAKKNTYFSKFRIQNVFAAKEERKNRLSLTLDLFYNKDSLDDADFDENKKMTLDCYIEQYINKDDGKKYVPIQLVFSAAKYDLDNERHKKLLDYKMKYLKIKSKKMMHIPWEVVLLRGAEEAEFDESMLTDSQREQVELGIKTVDDFRPKGNIYGDRIDEFRLFDPKLEGDFADGLLEVDDTPDEFEEKIFVPAEDETLEQAKNNSKKAAAKKSKDDEDDDPPFDADDKKSGNGGLDDEDLF
jgi:hypothetical protein